MKMKIDGWSTRFLSQGGKKVFVKSVLQAIPTYSIMCFLLPKTLCKKLEGIIAKFFWKKGHGRRDIHWCGWDKMFEMKLDAGMGFQSLAMLNIALLAK